ncbi:MAG: transcriptional activator NhaR [Steroidobacteraceae bacterium]
MRHLNYNHLLYFWTVVREGGIGPAAAALHLTPQTVSGQIKLLEDQLQGALFEKQGRRLVPTELGRLAYDYAQEIFPRGLELASLLRGARSHGRRSVTIGVSDAVPKLVTWRMLAPLVAGDSAFKLVCHEGALADLLTDLAAHKLDLVLSTSALPADSGIKAFSHLLGESTLGFFAAPTLAKKLRRNFPHSLQGAPLLAPTDRSAGRRVLDAWLEARGVSPSIVGEFDDSALIKTFAQQGLGACVAPLAIAKEIEHQYGIAPIGTATDLVARFYAISTERKIRHPAVAAITMGARSALFAR